jgi:hypothetical protein
MSTEREEFEKWWLTESQRYRVGKLAFFECWQAARRTAPAVPASTEPFPIETDDYIASQLSAAYESGIREGLEMAAQDSQRLDFIESHHEWHIDREWEDGDDDWMLSQVRGSINDREYVQVGKGKTLRDAIDNAMIDERGTK